MNTTTKKIPWLSLSALTDGGSVVELTGKTINGKLGVCEFTFETALEGISYMIRTLEAMKADQERQYRAYLARIAKEGADQGTWTEVES